MTNESRASVKSLAGIYRAVLLIAAAAALLAGSVLQAQETITAHLQPIGKETGYGTLSEDSLSKNVLRSARLGRTLPIFTVPAQEEGQETLLPISTRDLRAARADLIRNETAYDPDLEALLASAAFGADGTDAPTVLILHTHATEGYAAGRSYAAGETFRTTDPTQNVIAVGEALAQALCEKGFHVFHCTEQHDAISFNAAYDASARSVREALAAHPEIGYIIDLHRDAVEDGSGGVVRCAAEIDGTDCAQLMLVVGTDERGGDHPYWKMNLSLALALQSRICNTYPGLARRIDLRGATFNQQYSPGYLLLEVGSSGNTLEEAKRAARLFAEVFAEVTDPG